VHSHHDSTRREIASTVLDWSIFYRPWHESVLGKGDQTLLRTVASSFRKRVRSFILLYHDSKAISRRPRRMKYHPHKLQHVFVGIPRPCCSTPRRIIRHSVGTCKIICLFVYHRLHTESSNKTSVSRKERDHRKSFVIVVKWKKIDRKEKISSMSYFRSCVYCRVERHWCAR